MADESETPLDPGCGDLDELLIFGNPETRRQFIKQIAGTGVAITIGVNFVSASDLAMEQPAAAYAHAPVETMNCVADVRENHCTLWVPTQAPERLQNRVGELLGIPRDKVEVNITLIGGGFGRRLGFDYAVEAAEIRRCKLRDRLSNGRLQL